MTGRLAGWESRGVKQPRRLVIVRHAEAEQAAATDADRALAPSGHDDARAGGAWLASQDLVPHHAVVSAARRAQETWAALAAGAGWELEAEVSRPLYSAEPETALDLLREVPHEAAAVVVVGHNPTMAYLANLVDDGSGDEEAGAELTTGGFPTCSIAVFEYDGAWSDLDVTSARLLAFHVGRG